MKTTSRSLTFLLFIFCLLFSSCGPSKKLAYAQSRVDKLQKDSIQTQSQLNDCYAQARNLIETKKSLQEEYDLIQNDLKDLSTESKMTIASQAKRLKILSDISSTSPVFADFRSERPISCNVSTSLRTSEK